jgi:hypothetical protein
VNAILDAIRNQPVRFAALVAIAINIGVSFGLQLTGDQIALLNAFVVTLLGLIVPSFTTPTNNPTLPAGTTVNVVTPAGQPNTTTTV